VDGEVDPAERLDVPVALARPDQRDGSRGRVTP
jgi:hypothetical protein